MDDVKSFSKDVRIHFRCTNFKKRKIKKRAAEMGLDISKYILMLIDTDLESKNNDLPAPSE